MQVSIPSSSGQAFERVSFCMEVKCRVSIPSSSGQAFELVKTSQKTAPAASQSLLRQGKRSNMFMWEYPTDSSVSIPSSSGQAFEPFKKFDSSRMGRSQSLLRQGKRSNSTNLLEWLLAGKVSIPSSSGQAFEPPFPGGTALRKNVSIPSSSGQAFEQTGVDNRRIINELRYAMCSRMVCRRASLRVRLFVC